VDLCKTVQESWSSPHMRETSSSTDTATPVQFMSYSSPPRMVALILPTGEVLPKVTEQEAKLSLPWLPAGTRIDPPLPPGNPVALAFLDRLLSHEGTE